MSPRMIAALCAGLSLAVHAAEPLDLPARTAKLHVSYVINPDGSRVETREAAVKVLKPQAVEYAKQTSIGYSTSVEKAEILEAYTLKADGRRLDAPKSNYQLDINKGRDADSPAFSDRTRLSVIFPEVAVGDTVVFKYRVAESEPLFARHFSVDERFNRFNAYDDVQVRIDTPAEMWTQSAVTAMKVVRDEQREGRHVIEWSWSNPAPEKAKRRGYAVYDPDREPGYAFSTFRTYGEIAEAYGGRARPKAVASERVKALAEEVTAQASTPAEQARALYEWVATNIHYAGNCVGVGAVVPRDQSFVLDNRLGDCKDQATLLQALLAAKGIASTQALVNSGSTYRLPKVPVLSRVNHVIVYIPSLDVYLDTTSGSTPFGMLPMGDADKPVLWVDGYRADTRTPPLRASANRQAMKSEMEVKEDGSIGGTIDVSVTGAFAVSGRDRLRDMTTQQKEEFLETLYRRDNKTGFGRLESDDPKPMSDRFHYKVTFETEEFSQMPGPGAFTISPLYMTEAPINALAASAEEEAEGDETPCFGGDIVEEYVYKLPKGVKILAVPKDVNASNATVTYRSSYALEGNTLKVKRELSDKTERNVCPASTHREFTKLARKISADLKAQVVYQ
jgi:transglutaminase-like putative cysteine protease